VVSVTSELTATVSFQSAPARPARSEQAPANDSFASLVDGNTAATDNNSRAGEPVPPPSNNPPTPRLADDTTATVAAHSRDNSAPEKNANSDSAECDAAPAEQASTDTDTEPAAAKRSKSQATKADDATAKPDSGETPAVDSTDIKLDITIAAAADAIAVAIPVIFAVTNVPATISAADTNSSPGSTAPLAIAAAAIAATASLTDAATAPVIAAASVTSSTQDDATATTAPAAVAIPDAKTEVKAEVKAEVKTAAAATAAETLIATGQPTASAEPTAAADVALAASIAAPVAAKAAATTAKTSPVVADAAAKAGEQDATGAAADASATTTTTAAAAAPGGAAQPITPAPKNGENAASNAVKPDQSDVSSPTVNAAAHGPAVSAEVTQTSAGSPNNIPQATSTVQPQVQPAAAAQAAPSFNVTAATPATAVPLTGLAMEIAVTARSGESRFEIRLDPAELGRIDVRIDIDRNGQVTSHLTVEKPETLSLLRHDAPQLQRALNDAGLSTGSGDLQFSLRDQSSSGQNNGNQQNPNAQRLIVSEDTIPAAAAGRSYGRMLGASGGVDIRV
jgi:flagellar hook-length control protein FliK